MTMVVEEILSVLHELMLAGIKYENISGSHWEMSRIEEDANAGIVRYLSNLYKVQHDNKSLFNYVECDSEVERKFAKDLDKHENVRLFFKLPSWFKIDTPIGAYNPDWALVTETGKKLYFVCETKGTLDADDRRIRENQKIVCGKKHFGSLDVPFKVVTKLSDVPMNDYQ